MLNHVTIMGRMTRDPELRQTGSGVSVANFSLAVERDYTSKGTNERETDFIDCVAWRGGAEFVSKYFRKGSMAVVSGRIQTSKWVDEDGNNRKKFEILVESIYFGEGKKKDNSSGSGSYDGDYSSGSFKELDDGDDGELPF